MQNLELGAEYTREDVHNIFSPETTFTPQAGTWGLQGIVRIPWKESDFVFFVSYGQSQGDHNFDEGITEDGVLSWQSQPSQGFDNKVIKTLLEHDELVSNIYLFLRETVRGPYQYMGRLGYLTHDATREKPVYFQWQLLDWDVLHSESSDSDHEPEDRLTETIEPAESEVLTHSRSLPTGRSGGVSKEQFRGRKETNFALRDERNKKLGLRGELLVLNYEADRLVAEGRPDLAEKIEHTSVVIGDGTGFDIKSYDSDGSPRFIEVKTTKGGINTDFFLSSNELHFANNNPKQYVLYRIFNFDGDQQPEFYTLTSQDLLSDFVLEPQSYRVRKLHNPENRLDINFLKESDLSPGDVLLCYSENLSGKSEHLKNGYSHVAIVTGDGSVSDSDSSGIKKTNISTLLEDYGHIAVLRNPELWSPDRIKKLNSFVDNKLGLGFNRTGVFRLPERKAELQEEVMGKIHGYYEGTFKPESHDRNIYFCSEFITAAFIEVGIIEESASIVFSPETFTPEDIGNDKAFGFFVGYIKPYEEYLIPENDHFRTSI